MAISLQFTVLAFKPPVFFVLPFEELLECGFFFIHYRFLFIAV